MGVADCWHRVTVLKGDPPRLGSTRKCFQAAPVGAVRGLGPKGAWPTGKVNGKVNGTEGDLAVCYQEHVCSAEGRRGIPSVFSSPL